MKSFLSVRAVKSTGFVRRGRLVLEQQLHAVQPAEHDAIPVMVFAME